jgi:transposase
MRFIKLEDSERQELNKFYHTHSKSHVRRRAHCLLLSDKGYSVPKLAAIFFTRTHTVRCWFDRWQSEKIKGLDIRPGRGLKPTIREEDTALVSSIREEVSLDPRNLSRVVEKLNAKWGISLTVKQVKNFLKKNLNTVGAVFVSVSKSVRTLTPTSILSASYAFT